MSKLSPIRKIIGFESCKKRGFATQNIWSGVLLLRKIPVQHPHKLIKMIDYCSNVLQATEIMVVSVHLYLDFFFLFFFFFFLRAEIMTTSLASSWQRKRGRSQPVTPVWHGQDKSISSIFPHFPVVSLIFPWIVFIFFLILVFRVGDSPTREGPGYATERKWMSWYQFKKKTKTETKTKTKIINFEQDSHYQNQNEVLGMSSYPIETSARNLLDFGTGNLSTGRFWHRLSLWWTK